jgi:hypothetical protein
MNISSKNKNSIPKKSKKQHVLLLFLGIATFFWFLTKLSKEYTSVVEYNVHYKNLPEAKMFQREPEKKIALHIRGSGFKLLGQNLYQRTLEFDIANPIHKNKYHYYILTNAKKPAVQSQLETGLWLEYFERDSLFFDLGIQKYKTVPVVASVDMEYKLGYSMSGEIKILPDSVKILGPEAQVDKIQLLKTESMVLKGVSENVYQEVSLKTPKNSEKVKFYNEKVTVVVKVEKFTEDSFEVPFTIKNLPKNSKITTYPKTVRVTFKVGLSDYNKISPNSFKVVCDYSKTLTRNLDYLVPDLLENPDWVTAVKLNPGQIEFLIQKE